MVGLYIALELQRNPQRVLLYGTKFLYSENSRYFDFWHIACFSSQLHRLLLIPFLSDAFIWLEQIIMHHAHLISSNGDAADIQLYR